MIGFSITSIESLLSLKVILISSKKLVSYNLFKELLIKFSLYSLPIFNSLKTIIDSFEILLLPVISIELII